MKKILQIRKKSIKISMMLKFTNSILIKKISTIMAHKKFIIIQDVAIRLIMYKDNNLEI